MICPQVIEQNLKRLEVGCCLYKLFCEHLRCASIFGCATFMYRYQRCYLCAYKKSTVFCRKLSISGGAEGNRTPVRRQLDKTFSERSLLFTFPHPGGNKHPMGISSFMMHGALKALRTHGLHSNHTRARLVDLPGRMGA